MNLAYDALGQLIAEGSQVQGATSILRHAYDALGNRIQTILPDGRALNQLFYGSGHLHQISIDGEVVSDIERDAAHREVRRTQGALTSEFDYDPVGRLTAQLARLDPTRAGATLAQQRSAWQGDNASAAQGAPAGGGALIARQYRYDRAGNLVAVNDQRAGSAIYQYDVLGRILSAVQPQLSETFAFDPAHNLLDPATSGEEGGGGRLKNNRLTVFGDKRYAYDVHGNLVDKKIARHTRMTLVWNAAHQLAQSEVTRNAQHSPTVQVTEYGYDPFGRRVCKRDAFGETRFTWDGNRLVAETRGCHTRTYLYEGASFVPLAQVDSVRPAASEGSAAPASDGAENASNIYYFHTDHLGTPRELTDTDGNLQWAATYRAWGNVLRLDLPHAQARAQHEYPPFEQAQALRFQGQYFDIETGLHYNRFRYYDPDIGRFVSQDPIGLNGGNHLYQYAPNPSGWIDPSGLDVEMVDPNSIHFSQAYVRGQTVEYEKAMKEGTWDWNKFAPDHQTPSALTVVEIDGQLVSFDNRRLLAAQNAGLAEVPVVRVNLEDTKPGTSITWQESLNRRLNSKPHKNHSKKTQLEPNGSANKPKVCICK